MSTRGAHARNVEEKLKRWSWVEVMEEEERWSWAHGRNVKVEEELDVWAHARKVKVEEERWWPPERAVAS